MKLNVIVSLNTVSFGSCKLDALITHFTLKYLDL